MQQAGQPNPQAQQMAMAVQESQIALQQSQTAALNGQAAESEARATKMLIESELLPQELQIDVINAVTKNMKEGNEDDKEFKRRLELADRLLAERKINNDQERRTNRPPPENAPTRAPANIEQIANLARQNPQALQGAQQ
jgi:formaldehyde-activating enzyme involved in methanogenesis